MIKATFAYFASHSTQAALGRFSDQLLHAAKHPGDPDAIHDLRVSIRRYTQCLRTFEDLFDRDAVKRIRKRLRTLMAFCGEARNCDIATELLHLTRLPVNNPLYASLHARRRDAKKALVRHLGKKRWTKFARRNRLRLNPSPSRAQAWDLDGSVARNAQTFLPPMCADFFAAGSAAAASHEDYETLHQFRLRTKRFRYTLELFEEAYGPSIHRRLAAIRAVQDRLGEINDCFAALELIETNGVAVRLVKKLLAGRDRTFRIHWQSAFAGIEAQVWSQWLAGGRVGKRTENGRRRHKSIVTENQETVARSPSHTG